MSALNLAANAPPVILSENYLNRYSYDAGDLVASDGNDFVQRLYDGVPESKFATLESDNTQTETIEGGLYLEGAQVVRSIDFWAVLNHNLGHWKLEFSADNGATWPVSYEYTGDTTSDRIVSAAAPFDANRWRLTMYTVQDNGESPAYEQKEVGEVIFALASHQFSVGFGSSPDVAPMSNAKVATMADGSKRSAFIDRADEGHEFYRASCMFHGASAADRNAMIEARRSSSFLFMPWPGDSQREIYLGWVVLNSYRERYVDFEKSLGWMLSFDFEETGGS